MINLIKMDLYRMVHSISTWVMLLVTVGIALFCVAMVNIDLEDMAENPQYSEETSQMGIVSFQIEVKTQDAQEETEETENSEEEQQIGLYADSDPGWIEGQILAGDLISTQLESGILTLLCVIFAAIFFNGDQRNGFLKNIAGQYPNRGILVISKMTAAAVQILLMEILFAMATGVTAEIIWGEQFVLGSIPQMLPFLCVQYLLNLGAAGLILFLCTLTRSAAFGMTAGILMIMGILLPVYSAEYQPVCTGGKYRCGRDGGIFGHSDPGVHGGSGMFGFVCPACHGDYEKKGYSIRRNEDGDLGVRRYSGGSGHGIDVSALPAAGQKDLPPNGISERQQDKPSDYLRPASFGVQ